VRPAARPFLRKTYSANRGPRAVVRGPRASRSAPWFVVPEPRLVDRGPRAGSLLQLRLKRSIHAGFAAIRAARAAPRGERGLEACFSQIITSKFVPLQKRGFIKLVSAY
jgi:hypothetical protein